MSKKIRNMCLAFALASVVGISASACTIQSKHPNAKITVSFNSKTYEIEYTLYRNMYPQTVQHFIELADSGFYNDMIVHDYKSSDFVTGGYSYDGAEEGGYKAAYDGGSMAEYLETHCKEKNYYDLVTAGIANGEFSASVFTKSIYNDKGEEIVSNENALPTLIGEFSENNHKIENNKALTASYGTLKMVYYKKDIKPVSVCNSFGQVLSRDYNYNCATSLFSMQVGSSTSYDASKYCVFAQLKDDSARDALGDLTDAISDYSSKIGSSKLTTTVKTTVDREDKFADDSGRDIEASFAIISMPIIILKVEITKY